MITKPEAAEILRGQLAEVSKNATGCTTVVAEFDRVDAARAGRQRARLTQTLELAIQALEA